MSGAALSLPTATAAATGSAAANGSRGSGKSTERADGDRFDRWMQSSADASPKTTDDAKAGSGKTAGDPAKGDDPTSDPATAASPATTDPAAQAQQLVGLIQNLMSALAPATMAAKTAAAATAPAAGGTAPTPRPSSPQLKGLTPGATPAAADAEDDGDLPALPKTGVPGESAGVPSFKAAHAEVSGTLSATLTAAVATALTGSATDGATHAAGAAVAVTATTFSSATGTATAVAPQASVPVPTEMPSSSLDAAELQTRLGERLRWLVDGGVQEARLRLHPQELGSIDIRVRVESGSARVWFAAEHPAARAALETALPQLRERFAGDGLSLQSSAVSSQGQGWDTQGQSRSSPYAFVGNGNNGAADDDPLPAVPSATAALHDGLVDRYA